MFNQRRQWLILAIGLWFIVFAVQAHADNGQVPAKPKALAHYIMAVIHDLNGDNDQAIKEYEKSVQFDRHQPSPHLRLAAYYSRLGKQNEAVKQLKITLQLLPDSVQAHYLLALIYSSQNKYLLATNEYERMLKINSQNDPQDLEVHSYLAQLYLAQNKIPQSTEELKQVLALQPENVAALFLLGSIYSDANENVKAKEVFKKILTLEPENDEALNALAYIYAEEGVNLSDALKMARKAVAIDPTNGAYYDTLGWVLFKQGFKAEGLMALEKATNYLKNPIIFEHIGDVYQAANEAALARKYWMKAQTLDPKNPRLSQKIQKINHSSAKVEEVDHNPAMK